MAYNNFLNNLSESEKYVLRQVRKFEADPTMRKTFDFFFSNAIEILKNKYEVKYILENEVDVIKSCSILIFDEVNKIESKQYDVSIYSLITLGVSYAVDRIHAENKKHKYSIDEMTISDSERGEIESMKGLFKKYGLPNREVLSNWNFK